MVGKSVWAGAASLLLLLMACDAGAGDGAKSVAAAPTAAPTNADDLLVVDCRLPGRVQKLGTSMIYQMPGSIIRTPAHDCEIRGGEYTVLDPSKYKDAIRLWMDDAQRGDAKAETNVGMLYEKIDPPDYAAAASWYAKAAAQGYAPAETALGRLYETGQGVPKDSVKAINFYRQASGLNAQALQLVTSAEPSAGEGDAAAQQKIRDLTDRLSQSRDQLDQLRRKLEEYQKRQQSNNGGTQSAGAAGLRSQIAQLEQQLHHQRQEFDEGKLGSLPPPRIEIVFPLSYRSENRFNISLRAEKDSDNVIARVNSAIGVERVTVDAQPVHVDDQNLFSIPARLLSTTGAARIEATDLLGRTATIEVAIARAGSAAPASDRPAASGAPGALGFGNYYALIIGDDEFRYWPHIDNAVNDARAIDEALRTRYGFKTTLLLNATRFQILSAFNDLRQKLGENDNLLVYYAGHGQLVSQIDRGYWIPVDAGLQSDTEWILNEQITDYLQIIPAKHIIIIADSCYSGILTRSSVETPKPELDAGLRLEALREMNKERVRTVMTSGGVQPVLDTGSGGHSVFANALLKILDQNTDLLEANRLFDAVSSIVITESTKLGYKQTPTYRAIVFAGHQGGDFVFMPR